MMMMKTVKILMTVAVLTTAWGCSTDTDEQTGTGNGLATTMPPSAGYTFEHADRPAWGVDLTGNDAAPDWGNFNMSLYENSMYVLVTLQEELAAHSTEADRMAVFIGGERRTQLAVPNFYDDGAVRYVLRIYGNSTDRNVRFTLQYYSVALKQLFSIGTEEKFVPEFTYGNIKDFVPPLLKGCKKFPVQNQLTVSLPDQPPFTPDNNDLVAVFVGDECRGVGVAGKPFNVFRTSETEKLTLRYYSVQQAGIYTMAQTVTAETDISLAF
jgi:hypothetical protein